jgi:FkbM family methyltransferase
MSTRRNTKQIVLDVARRTGTERLLREAYDVATPQGRRSRRDERSLELVMAWTLRPDSNCIDIGCYKGEILGEMVRLAPAGRHIAFEPIPSMHAALAARFPTVDVRHAAVGDEVGEGTFVHVTDEPAQSGLQLRPHLGERPTETFTVARQTLDASLPEGYVPHFVKIDVEGAEGLVLRGARETLRRHRPVLFFEHGMNGAEYYGTSSGEIHDQLVGDAGYRIFDTDGRGPYSREEFVAVFAQPMWNFVAHA